MVIESDQLQTKWRSAGRTLVTSQDSTFAYLRPPSTNLRPNPPPPPLHNTRTLPVPLSQKDNGWPHMLSKNLSEFHKPPLKSFVKIYFVLFFISLHEPSPLSKKQTEKKIQKINQNSKIVSKAESYIPPI